LVDALFEIGKQRQQLLSNLRTAYEKHDLGSVLECVEQLIGLDKKVKEPSEKRHCSRRAALLRWRAAGRPAEIATPSDLLFIPLNL
jgi:hypothetical protein